MLIKVYFYFLLSKIIVKHILNLIPIDCSEHYPWNSKIILAKTTKNSFQCIKLIPDSTISFIYNTLVKLIAGHVHQCSLYIFELKNSS